MGSGVTESMSGRTVYTTESVGPNGDEITGRFERDGTRTGTFRMIRAGATEALKGAAKNQAELQRKRFQEEMNDPEAARAGVRRVLLGELEAKGVAPSDADLDQKARQAVDEARRTGDLDAAVQRAVDELSAEQ
jgi:hypothetical protein